MPVPCVTVTSTEPVAKISPTMDDGVRLDGWLATPPATAGRRLPTILWASPYFGQLSPLRSTGDDPCAWDEGDPNTGGAIPVQKFLDDGYAVAMVNIRGTGNSGGCLDMWGPREQTDMTELVDWVAAQPWSNGRVGMMGLSWDSGTAIEAAIGPPPGAAVSGPSKALKATVVAGIMTDIYTLEHTPNGAVLAGAVPTQPYRAAIQAAVSVVPPRSPSVGYMVQHAGVTPDRVCPEYRHIATADQTDAVGTDRDASFYTPRRFIDGFDKVKAAMFINHGFNDCGHCWQEDLAWQALTKAPKRMLLGTWQHEYPDQNTTNKNWAVDRDKWIGWVLRWMDSYVKTDGSDPAAGTVDYQDFAGGWHTSTAWPPAEATQQALYLTPGGQLSGDPGRGTSTPFLASPATIVVDANSGTGGTAALCDPTGANARVFATAPLAQPATIAGNPFAWLRLTSNLPGGIVRIGLVDLAPDFTCGPANPGGNPAQSAVPGGSATGWTYLGHGSVDLQFANGNMRAQPFPCDRPANVRVEITNFAWTVPAGHRLALVVSGAETTESVSGQYTPLIGIVADGGANASQIVLPIAGGSLGGADAVGNYPPRPFTPAYLLRP